MVVIVGVALQILLHNEKWDCSISTHLTEAPDFDCIQPILCRQGTRKIRKTYGTRPRYASILSTVPGEQNRWWVQVF